MKIVDANVLLNAVNEAAPAHGVAKEWLLSAIEGDEPIGFSWLVLLGFLRLSTQPFAFPAPLGVMDAWALVEGWLAQPPAAVLHPTDRHGLVLSGMLETVGTGGNLVNDAHLAALSLEHGGEVVTFDTDFARFPRIRYRLLR